MTGATPRTLVRDLRDHAGSLVRVCGWVHQPETGDGATRLTLRDHTGCVRLRNPGNVELADQVGELARESAIEAEGTVAREADGATTVVLSALRLAGGADSPLPLGADAALDARLDWRFLDLRDPRMRLIFEVQTTAERAMRALWDEQGFLELHSPKLRPLANKSGGDLFAVDYFGRRVFLTQSPQWYKQMAIAAGFDRVFEIGPAFRPQREATPRHGTEFTSVDVELAWISSLDDVMAHAETLMVRVTEAVRDRHGDDIERRFGVRVDVPDTPFPRVGFAEARRIVERSGHVCDSDEDLDPEGERLLAEHVARDDGDVVFVVDYPERARPYYHMLGDDGAGYSRSFDLLYRGLEIASGAQREHRHARLVAQARSRGVPVDQVTQYLDFFRFGCPPHGGFGLGLTRLLMSLLGVDDVREVTFLFRGPDRIAP